VTDVGVSALDAGCGKLQSIDLKFCDSVTDAGVSDATWVLCEGRRPHVSR
jgi:hypothetical protein